MSDVSANFKLNFEGRVALVTGAGRGLGREHALLLAARGASVVVNDLGVSVGGTKTEDDPAAEVVQQIRAAGGHAIANRGNVADADDVARMVDDAVSEFGRLDVVVNNAGHQIIRRIPELSPEEFTQQVDVHLTGAYLLTQAAWPRLVESGAGRVVNTTSTATLGIVGYAGYAAAKAALIGLTRTLALEGAADGVHVNAVAPSAVTRMAKTSEGAKRIPGDVRAGMQRSADPSLVSPVVAYLAHPSCDLNGEVLYAGGGRVSRIVFAETVGILDSDLTPETIKDRVDEITNECGVRVLDDAMARARAWAADPRLERVVG